MAEKICRIALALAGLPDRVEVVWESISLQDETEIAQARYTNARAAALEQTLQAKEETA